MLKTILETIKKDTDEILEGFYKLIKANVYIYPCNENAIYIKNKILAINPFAHINICTEEKSPDMVRDIIYKEKLFVIIATSEDECYINWHYQNVGIEPHNIYTTKMFDYVIDLIEDRTKIYDMQYLCNKNENAARIMDNIKYCETVFNEINEDISKQIYLRVISKHITGCPYFSNIKDNEEQYFNSNIIKLEQREVFVDVGSRAGETIESFKKYCSSYNMIYAIEPNPSDFVELVNNQKKCENITFINLGLGDRNDIAKFMLLDLGSSTFKNESSTYPYNISNSKYLDRCLICGDSLGISPTMIKMDIEGYELKALYGFMNTILHNKPKLAISVYHNICDLWEIPLFIKNINHKYELYYRHYSTGFTETVCYAIYKN